MHWSLFLLITKWDSSHWALTCPISSVIMENPKSSALTSHTSAYILSTDSIPASYELKCNFSDNFQNLFPGLSISLPHLIPFCCLHWAISWTPSPLKMTLLPSPSNLSGDRYQALSSYLLPRNHFPLSVPISQILNRVPSLNWPLLSTPLSILYHRTYQLCLPTL